MRIGVMLRSLGQQGGVGIYTRNIVEELLKIDRRNEYVLYYRENAHVGRFRAFPNVREHLVESKNRAAWDQVLVPRLASRHGVDLIFHPKFTLPIYTKAKTVMVVHGADWFLPQFRSLYHPLDVLYMRLVMPLYLRKADAVISVSKYSTQGFVNAMPWCAPKMRTIYFAAKDIFRPISEPEVLSAARAKYALPDRFILTVIHYDSGRKNFANMLEAFRIAKQRGLPHTFVVVGRDCQKYAREHPLRSLGLADSVRFFDWIEQVDLPAVYNLADLYLYPTRVEAFPIPICEAMSCGCPIVTSNGTGLAEIGADAVLSVDPENPLAIAEATYRVLDDPALRDELRRKGIARSKTFSWAKCARETLAVFDSLAEDQVEGSKKPLRQIAS